MWLGQSPLFTYTNEECTFKNHTHNSVTVTIFPKAPIAYNTPTWIHMVIQH